MYETTREIKEGEKLQQSHKCNQYLIREQF